MLEIKGLKVKLEEEDKQILKGVDLNIEPGTVHAIMGPNGSGKSTLSYVLSGRDGYEVTDGAASLLGEDVLEMEPEERAAAGLFLAFQYPVEVPGVATMTFLKHAMNAQRAARGLGSLYAHANEMTMEEAGGVHMKWTPRGWMKTEKELLIFEQHLYLRQPGYGTSYITGKYLLENAMADYARIQESKGEQFISKNFFDLLNSIGNIPISLGHWEMTGEDTHLEVIRNR